MLKGTAAGSIAAIASAHGVAASAAPSGPGPVPYPNALGAGYGNLEGGAFAGFVKLRDSVAMQMRWHYAAAELLYKEDPVNKAVDAYFKHFDKARGWGDFQKVETFLKSSLQGAVASFLKVDFDSATTSIFLEVNGEGAFIKRNFYADVDVCEPNTVGCEGPID